MTSERKNNEHKTSGWLMVGAIVLATLVVLWLAIFEYWGAVEEGDIIRVATDSVSVE